MSKIKQLAILFALSVFSTCALALVNVATYGILPTNTAAVNDTRLANLVAATPNGETIQWNDGIYLITGFTWPTTKRFIWQGVSPIETTPGNLVTTISGSGAVVITLGNSGSRYSQINNMRIVAAAGNTALLIANLGTILNNVIATGGAIGIEVDDCVSVSWNNVTAYGTTAGLNANPAGAQAVNINTIINLSTSSNNATGTGIILNGSGSAGSIKGNTFINADAENSNGGFDLNSVGPQNNTFVNPWIEGMAGIAPFSYKEQNGSNSIYINGHDDGSGTATYGTGSTIINGASIQAGSTNFVANNATGINLDNSFGTRISSTGTRILKHWSNSVSVAAANYSANPIVAFTTATFTITVTGARATNVDSVFAGPDGDIGAGLVWSAKVSANDTVTVTVANVTAGNITPTTHVWRASVFSY